MTIIGSHGAPDALIAPWYLRAVVQCPRCYARFYLEPQDIVATLNFSDVISQSGITTPLAQNIGWQLMPETHTIMYPSVSQVEYDEIYGPCAECQFTIHIRSWFADEPNPVDLTLNPQDFNTEIAWTWARIHNIKYAMFIYTEAKEYIVLGMDDNKNLLYNFDPAYPSRVWAIYQNPANHAFYIGVQYTPEAHYQIIPIDEARHLLPDLCTYIETTLGLIIINDG